MPMLNHVAEQVGADPASFELYARREETRMNHVARLLSYLEMRSPTGEDRRAALLAAIETASTTDKGALIANAIIVTYRERRVLLPVAIMIERMGLAARAIARRRAEAALISDLDPDKLETLDALLAVDPAIGQTRFHWLRSAPDAPGAGNLVGLTERIMFLRSLGVDPRLHLNLPPSALSHTIRKLKAVLDVRLLTRTTRNVALTDAGERLTIAWMSLIVPNANCANARKTSPIL